MLLLQIEILFLMGLLRTEGVLSERGNDKTNGEHNEYGFDSHHYKDGEEKNIVQASPDLQNKESVALQYNINSNINESLQKRSHHKYHHHHFSTATKPINRKRKHVVIKIHPNQKKLTQPRPVPNKNVLDLQNDDVQEFHTFEETHEQHFEPDEKPHKAAASENNHSMGAHYEALAEEQLVDPDMDGTQHFHSEDEKHESSKKVKIKHHHHHHHHNHVKQVEKKIPYPIEKIVHVPIEKIVEKIVHVPKPYPIEKLVHVPKPYPVEKIVEKKVPYPVEKVVRVPIHIPIEKVVEKIVHIPKPFPVEKIVHVPIEKIIEKKIPYPVEKVIHVPIEKIVEKIVHVPQPYPVEKIVNKIVSVPKPYPIIKPMPYPVEVKVPYHVETLIPHAVEKKTSAPYKVQVEKQVPIYVSSKEPHQYEYSKLETPSKGGPVLEEHATYHDSLDYHPSIEEGYAHHHDLSPINFSQKPTGSIYRGGFNNYNYQKEIQNEHPPYQYTAQESKQIEVTLVPPRKPNNTQQLRINVSDGASAGSVLQPMNMSTTDVAADLMTDTNNAVHTVTSFQSIAVPLHLIHLRPLSFQQPTVFSTTTT